MVILHVAIAKLDQSLLKEPREEAFKNIHKMIADIPVPKHDVRVGAPINPSTTRGYDIMLSMKFETINDFKAYLAHPNHMKLLKRYGPPLLRDMISYQIDGTAPQSKL
ncbi:hypothetical protein NUW54_g4360 [Trametes sanguinea]|uniref:Uncharacterized protein n=1 Tax=Trametes sanguinea TaxID=158606 RepID=A0ACC1PZE7_9APHY|nr:hypothetical protein NUW54_g4360 [Trametes sanguinea]